MGVRKLVASALVVGMASVAVATGVAGSATAASSPAGAPSAAEKAAAKAFVVHLLRQGVMSPVRGVRTKVPRSTTRTATSYVTTSNWSGYADDHSSGATYTTVVASWTDPAIVKCASLPRETYLSAFWVGMDGFGDNTVEQDGTINVCEQGTAFAFDWYEMYPAGLVFVKEISPGDLVSALVTTDSAGTYRLAVLDWQHLSASFSTNQFCSPSKCRHETAEWIGEAPCCSTETQSGEYPLAPFRTWKVTGARANGTDIAAFPNDRITLVNATGTYALVVPGRLGRQGTTFGDKFERSS